MVPGGPVFLDGAMLAGDLVNLHPDLGKCVMHFRQMKWRLGSHLSEPPASMEPSLIHRRRPHLLAGPTIRRRRLGTDLRRLREERSLRLEDVAAHLGVAPSTLSRIETGKAPTRTSYLSLMLDLYGVDDSQRRRLLTDLAREGQRKGWWADSEDLLAAGAGNYLGLEAEASVLRSFAILVGSCVLQ